MVRVRGIHRHQARLADKNGWVANGSVWKALGGGEGMLWDPLSN